MEINTSCRLSANGYDTANEDSISMYYSFNGSIGDKTLENSDLESTVDLTIEDSTGTVIKAPPQGTTPIKGKCSRTLKLDSARASTPSDMRKKLLVKSVNINPKTLTDNVVPKTINHSQEIATSPDVQNESLDCMIVESLSELKINTHTDSSIGIAQVCDKSNISVESSDVLKDASMKMWSENNQVEMVDLSKDLSKLNGGKSVPQIIISDVIDKDKSLAEKVVKDMHTLLQGSEKQMASLKGKENIQQKMEEANNADKAKMETNLSKKPTGLLKPSRLSTFKTRKSILQGDIQSSTKTVTPITRISANPRKSIASSSTGIPTLRESSSSTSLQSTAERNETNVSRSTMLPKKRMSILPTAKSSLNSIPEIKQQSDSAKKTKRFSFMNAKPTPRFRPMAKTTLSSPVMARKDYMRRSVSKFATSAALPVNKGNSTTFKKTSIPEVVKSETSQNRSNVSLDKVKSAPAKTHIPREDFVCEICYRSFRVSSIFEAHKKTHNPATPKEINICKFCDKTFAIVKALDKHLLENCMKIPLAERKKIKIAASQASEEARADNSGIGRNRTRSQRASILPTSEKINSRKSVMNGLMPPPSTTKIVRMPVAHSGIVKTPNKTVSCKPCEKSFDNVLAFAEHVLSHSNSSLGEE